MLPIYVSNRIISVRHLSAHPPLWSVAVVISQSGGYTIHMIRGPNKNIITATYKEFRYYGAVDATTTGRC